ncbi:hypothetical protein FHR47_003294 [Xanthomonas arboricola]|nr:hypothetical protein [Xanthomonas cannabis]
MVGAQSFQPATDTLRDAAFPFFNRTTSQLSGVVSSPIAGPLTALMPPTSLYDGFTACPASGEGAAPSTDLKIAKRSRDARCSRRYLIAQFWKIRRKTDHLRRCCRALARPPSRDTLQVRPCSSVAASVPPWLPRRWAGKDQSSWLVRKVLNEQRQAATRCLDSSTKPPAICLAWCPRRLRDRVAAWCRHRATWTYLRHVPQAVRAPRPRPTRHLAWTSDSIAKTWPGNHCTHANTHAHARTHARTPDWLTDGRTRGRSVSRS